MSSRASRGRYWSRESLAHRLPVALFVLGVFGCDNESANSQPEAGVTNPLSSTSDLPSPNAKILPEPLKEAEPNGAFDSGEVKTDAFAVEPEPRPVPVPWTLRKSLEPDEMRRGVASGLRLEARFAWPQVARTVQQGGELIDTWPLLQIELLRESARREARQRWRLASSVFPFPEGTELRTRADRLGHLVVWPDARSYRVVRPGALRSLFADRRVDRVPFVESVSKRLEPGKWKERVTEVVSLETALGTAVLETVEQTDLPSAATLLCQTLLELGRIRAQAELCPLGRLPVHFEMNFEGGGQLVFEVTALQALSNLNVEGFRAPPLLPIFKLGELPPSEPLLLEEPVRSKVFPFEAKSQKLVADPAFKPEPTEAPLPGAPPVEAPPVPQRIKNEVTVTNREDRPILLLVNRVPLRWLAPGEKETLFVKPEGARFSARDFFGERIIEGGVVTPPADVVWGEELAPASSGENP